MNKTTISRTYLLILVFCIGSSVYGQERVFFVSGTPFFYKTHFPEKKPLIFSFNRSDNLIDTLQLLGAKDSLFLSFINVYNDQNILVMHEESANPKFEQFLTIVDLKHPETSKRKKIDFGSIGSRDSYLIVRADSISYCMHFGGKGYFAFDKNLKMRQVNPYVLSNAYIKGNQGISINTIGSSIKLGKKNDRYFIQTRLYRDTATIKLMDNPSKGIIKKWGTYRYFDALQVNTQKIRAIVTNNSIPDKNTIGKIGYLIKNTANTDWYYREFKGGRTGLLAFDDWLCGFVEDYNNGSYYVDKGKPIEYNFGKISPGVGNRKPLFLNKEEETRLEGESESFEERAGWFGSFYPGILFLFNTKTKMYIEWNTFQGDSEVLLIQNNNVLFRVNDSIFQADINGNKISNQKLLVKDDRVRDIHWAFINQ